ncbi:MAG: ABC transporter substrate-binding protein [Terriglobales bacterium]
MKNTTTDLAPVSRRQFVRTAIAGGAAAFGAVPVLWKHARAAEAIRIGALCELSGPASTIGSQQALGIRMAVDEINKTGGILGKGPGIGGRPITLILEDTESKVATGLAKAKKLVERERVDALTGIIFSAISLSVQEYVNKDAKIPFLNAGSGNPAISEPPACGKYTFQGLPNSRQLVLPSLYAAKKHGAKWFFMADDYSWGRLSVQLTKDAIKLGSPLEVVGEEYPPFGTTNYAPYITKAMAAKPDVLGIIIFGAGYARVLKQIHQMGAKVHIHHNFWSQVDANAAGEAVLGMTAGEAYTYENPRVPRAAEFAKKYRAVHGAWPDPAAARGYNGVEVLALAIAQAGSTNPDAVVKALETMVFKESLMGELRFRECDHLATTTVFVVEGKYTDDYKYYPAYIEDVPNPNALLIPCGKTGCELLTHPRS